MNQQPEELTFKPQTPTEGSTVPTDTTTIPALSSLSKPPEGMENAPLARIRWVNAISRVCASLHASVRF